MIFRRLFIGEVFQRLNKGKRLFSSVIFQRLFSLHRRDLSAIIQRRLVQARAGGLVAGDLEALRALVRTTQEIRRYEPRTSAVRQER